MNLTIFSWLGELEALLGPARLLRNLNTPVDRHRAMTSSPTTSGLVSMLLLLTACHGSSEDRTAFSSVPVSVDSTAPGGSDEYDRRLSSGKSPEPTVDRDGRHEVLHRDWL